MPIAALPPAVRPGPIVLLVDDRVENLTSMCAILEDCGADLHTAGSGQDALELMLNHDIALVLLDVQMPEMDGYEVLQLMRSNRRTRHIPTLFVTAHARDEVAQLNGYQSGAIDYILKPIQAPVLRSKVRQFLELDGYKRRLQEVCSELDLQKAFYAAMLNAAGEGVLGIDAAGTVNFANPMAMRLLSAGDDSLIGSNFAELCRDNDDTPWQQTMFYRFWTEMCEFRLDDARLYRHNGEWLPVTLSCSPLTGRQRGSVVVFQDISVRKALEEQLRLQAITDHLTGLANRNGFKQALSRCLQRAQRNNRHVALIYIDLDHFKTINDTLGHDCGDKILIEVAQRLRHVVRSKDVVARLGGDEFTVVIDDLDEIENCGLIAGKMLEQLKQPYLAQGRELMLSASIGIALYPDNCQDSDQLMLAADLAMYRAKNGGRNAYQFFTSDMTIRARARVMLEQGLQRALDNHEFGLHYQPQFSIDGMRVRGIETLIRWDNNLITGTVSPRLFVPLLEQTGLIGAVGDWIISGAARQRRLWREAGLMPDDCPLAINLSPRQFDNGDLVATLARALGDNALEPGMLEVEVIESILMKNSASLAEIKRLGIRLAIDEFGSGDSSPARLLESGVDTVKIDISFISRIVDGGKDAAIAAAIISLAHHLGLSVIAEGVETDAQLAILRTLSCDAVQGFLLSQPIPSESVPALFERFNHAN
ncbi:putative bifunctional diguanylate cyclase/phosphodiesterase [Paludibacterium yongneupense]|uniref:putative bifunctional diguanylate cyclase/phosphodiesterase n=1 Tax=Paludibacterium yongneupense TaxID=400061 RepID=UPI00041BB0FC|nr:EAL domain-containing protein [Paludibacterium yongneupense]